MTQRDPRSHEPDVDVLVVGGGLAGVLAARALAVRGQRVALVQRHSEIRPEFRAEQIVGPQIDRLAELDVLSPMLHGKTLQDVTHVARGGRLVETAQVKQFGLPYKAMVDAAQAALPDNVVQVIGRVDSIETGDARQTAALADGRLMSARLIVLATGLNPSLIARAGLSVRTIRASHSLTIGFDLSGIAHRPFATEPLVYFPQTTSDRVDYLATFGMEGRLRANLFCYQAADAPWVMAFRRQPSERLFSALPGLRTVLGELRIAAPLEVRSNDLRVVADPVRDGLVLIGDAFQTPCPAAGTGIDRLLTDVEALARHMPRWAATPGMDRSKIATYYADPIKRAADTEALRIAEYRRAVSTENGIRWRAHRTRVGLQRRVRLVASGLMSNLARA